MFERLDPMNSPSNRAQKARSFDELVGLCRGIICDGVVVKGEAQFLLKWLESHDVIHYHIDVATLVSRLADALHDGVLDGDEERDLLEAIMGIAIPVDLPPWEFAQAQRELPASRAAQEEMAALPFVDAATPLKLTGATVVVTGVFQFGARDVVANALRQAGAIVGKNFTLSTRYLVVGSLGSAAWKNSSAGTKIEAAIAAKAKGQPVDIVSEAHLFDQIGR